MKRLMIGALLGAQLLTAAPPALAAELEPIGDRRMGAFGGLRVRLPLGGNEGDRHLRAGLAVAPVLHDRLDSGETRLRIGEGLEFGLRGRDPLRLSLAGRDLRRLGAQESDDDGGIPTGAWIAGGIMLAAVAFIGIVAIVHEGGSD